MKEIKDILLNTRPAQTIVLTGELATQLKYMSDKAREVKLEGWDLAGKMFGLDADKRGNISDEDGGIASRFTISTSLADALIRLVDSETQEPITEAKPLSEGSHIVGRLLIGDAIDEKIEELIQMMIPESRNRSWSYDPTCDTLEILEKEPELPKGVDALGLDAFLDMAVASRDITGEGECNCDSCKAARTKPH